MKVIMLLLVEQRAMHIIQYVSRELPGKELFKAMGSPELKAELLLGRIEEVFCS